MNHITEQLPKRLLDWFAKHQRDLPWRKEKNAYHTWVSEIMLQQTRVDTVIPYFYRFTEQFPTLEALADAPEQQVLKAWEGLGYYSRARNLQAAVREVKAVYDGVVPSTKEEISKLKGVGPYTAGAILSIAYGVKAAAVDGNVMRVFSRIFAIEEDITKGSTRVYMENLAEQMIPDGSAGDFNQALMELGALVCTPKNPQCLHCPVMDLCEGRMKGIHLGLPVKKKAKPPKPSQRVAIMLWKEGKFLVRKRSAEGLLANLWEIPHFEWEGDNPEDSLKQSLYLEHGISVQLGEDTIAVQHTFSHLHWNITVFQGEWVRGTGAESGAYDEVRWIRWDEIAGFPFPNVFLKCFEQWRNRID